MEFGGGWRGRAFQAKRPEYAQPWACETVVAWLCEWISEVKERSRPGAGEPSQGACVLKSPVAI